MIKSCFKYNGYEIPLYQCNTIIIGTGAASLNCAYHLREFGSEDLLIVTEKLGGGVSNNSGSDKQTYYKLSLFGAEPDSIYEMAGTLFRGGAMHGDIALVEAALSVPEFYHLTASGVPFPHNAYGGYVGYKTDHDPKQRATSAGPWTSNQMFQKLLGQVTKQGTPILDRHEIIFLLATKGTEPRVIGAVGLDKDKLAEGLGAVALFQSENIVMGTGGPGGLYESAVYPEGHLGSTGIALEAGAVAVNLAESQYGLASLKFRWNVSGTYQQVIPRYFSTDQDGNGAADFLNEYFPSMGKMATAIFLKGYQWPFDPRKIKDYGSSLIDILVYRETVIKGRRVFMDFQHNPNAGSGLAEFNLAELEEEAYCYLQNSQALLETPFERLQQMNPMAIELYRKHGIDLAVEPLEIAVCAQHNNGGLKGNIWWESNLRHLFPIGEANGTHGVYRPGGSALNSGQVGGYRAAQFIAANYQTNNFEAESFKSEVLQKLKRIQAALETESGLGDDLQTFRAEFQKRMTGAAAHIRNPETARQALAEALEQFRRMEEGEVGLGSLARLLEYFQARQLCLTQIAVLQSIVAYLKRSGGSRGSYLVLDEQGEPISAKLNEWKYRPERLELRDYTLEYTFFDGKHTTAWVPVREIPKDDFWFENVWQDYLEKKYFR